MTIIDQISGDVIDTTTVEEYATTYRDDSASVDNIYEPDALPSFSTFRRAVDRRDVMHAGPHLQCWALIDDGCEFAWYPVRAA